MAATQDTNRFGLISYNLHGLNQGLPLLDEMCHDDKVQIILVQEHWLTPANMSKILNFSNQYTGYGVSAMESAVSSSILRGRPWGGVATLVHRDYLSMTTCLACAERYTIVKIGHTLIVNVYFPCQGTDSFDIISTMILQISNCLNLYPDHEIIFGGDLNLDMANNSRVTNIMKQFIIDFKLILVNDVIQSHIKLYLFP
jgi:exonuclease III